MNTPVQVVQVDLGVFVLACAGLGVLVFLLIIAGIILAKITFPYVTERVYHWITQHPGKRLISEENYLRMRNEDDLSAKADLERSFMRHWCKAMDSSTNVSIKSIEKPKGDWSNALKDLQN